MKTRRLISITLSIILSFIAIEAKAFWVWTPETNKWVNPKFAVKETPGEQLEYALGFYQAKEYKEAMREFRKLLKHYPRAREAPEAQYYIGRTLEDMGELFEAFKEYQLVIDKYPFSERSPQVVQNEYNIGLVLLEGQEGRGMLKDTFAWDKYDVIEVFRTVIKNAPYGDLAPIAQYKIGLYLMEKGLYPEARDELEKVINDYPESEWVKAAKYQIAVTDAKRSTKAAYDQRVTKSAVEEFEEFVSIYPDAELSDDAKDQIQALRNKEAENSFLIAAYYEKRKNYKAAKIYYQSILQEYGNSIWSSKALERIQQITQKE